MSKRKYPNLFSIVVVSFLIGIVLGYTGNNMNIVHFFEKKALLSVKRQLDPVLMGTSEVSTCFTPPAGCGAVIASLIYKAQDSIYVQAYGFTSREIAKALINAHNRGVKVQVLLDKSNIGAKHSKMRDLREAGIELDIDNVSGIAHNKIIIIDNQKVITGSFNFTVGADIRNSENIIIVNNSEIAKKYIQNWFLRKKHSQINRLKKQANL